MTSRRAGVLFVSLTLGLAATALAGLPPSVAGAATSTPGTAPRGIAGAVSTSAAVSHAPLFRELTNFTLKRSRARVRPRDYSAYSVDLTALRGVLAAATPHHQSTVTVPDPDGRPVDFRVLEDSVMEPDMQAAHPEIRTYAGQATDGSGRSIRLDITPMGFHAFVRGLQSGSWYVDPAYNARGGTRHLSYYGAALPAGSENFVESELPSAVEPAADAGFAPGAGGVVSTRTYRLAFLTDPTYAAYFGSANVLAEKTSLINRVDEVYNDDLAIKFLLINGTDTKLNLDTAAKATGADGPCGADACFAPSDIATCSGNTLDRNEFVLGQLVGADAFDIGHIGLGVNGGGIAGLGVVGGASKADGCTGLPKPDGDFYAVDYVAHEMGHEMGGDHTFNGTQVNCSTGNRNVDPFTTQVEPGSGTSVMAYAGICGQDNLQPHSDPYFSFVSVEEIDDTTATTPASVDEEQVVNLRSFDGTDGFTISCAGCPNGANSVVNGTTYTALGIATAVSAATGQTVTAAEVSGYDGGLAPGAAGFTVDFEILSTGTDIPTLVITPTVPASFTTFTGTVFNGGPGTNQGVVAATANHAPTVTAPADKTIPVQTPFTLTGSATDSDGNSLVYLWEQIDAGGAQGTGLVDNTKTDGPLFRVFGRAAQVSATDTLDYHSPGENLADADPSRTFPDLAQVLAGNTNATTGACPAAPAAPSGGATNVPLATIDCYSEFLPTSDYNAVLDNGRTLNFRLTARDLFATGGGSWFDDVALTVDPSAGPFLVTSQITAGQVLPPGSTQNVTWDVNGTGAAGLAPAVRISLSTDGGATFPTVLQASTPNDGAQSVTLPNVDTAAARIKIEAVGNYFFDVNDATFAIGTAPQTRISAGPAAKSFVLTRKVRFRSTSTSTGAGSTFVCTLDRKAVPCAAKTRLRFKPGTHVFGVAARTPGGIVDPTPATRVFASPLNDGQLKRLTRGWKRVKDQKSYRGAYLVTDQKGQVLSRTAKKVTKVALVVHTGRGFGRVAVMLNGKTLKVLSLRGSSLRRAVLIPVGRLKGGKSGKITIKTLDSKPVRIDGLGLLTKP